MNRILSLISVLGIASVARAWHGNGHYTVAYIAQEFLMNTNPAALKWANDLLAPFTQYCGENLYPFVEAATWSDKIKDQNWHLVDNHHFISNYWTDEGATPYKGDNDTNANILFAINDEIKFLKTTTEDPYGSSKSILGKSLSLRMMIHYFGDLHQPLHAEERVTPAHPQGDMGGNLFKISYYNNSFMDNLHFIWDEMFDNYNESIRTNLPTPQYLYIKKKGDDLMKTYPYDLFKEQIAANNTPTSWGLESLQVAQTFAYKGLKEGGKLPQDYQDAAREICYKRVTIAGYRLGITLDTIYKAISTNSPRSSTTQEAGTESQ